MFILGVHKMKKIIACFLCLALCFGMSACHHRKTGHDKPAYHHDDYYHKPHHGDYHHKPHHDDYHHKPHHGSRPHNPPHHYNHHR